MRAVTADHVMFKECIWAFRPNATINNETCRQADLTGYLLMDFELKKEISLGEIKVLPTIRIDFPAGPYAAFIAPVVLPPWVKRHNAHLFTLALSAIFSFASGRPIRSTRDGYVIGRDITGSTLQQLAIQFPVLIAGPGCHDWNLSFETTSQYENQLKDTFSVLQALPYEDYVRFMQAIRLVNLAHLNKREDFALAYFLLISSIETIAQIAIKRKKVVEKHPQEEQWSKESKSNMDFRELFKAYKEERGKNQYLGKRFVTFILEYSTPETWGQLEHHRSNLVSYLSEITGDSHHGHLIAKSWNEIYPEDMSQSQIINILKDAYKHRSKFTHEGQSPPHKNPESYNRFFDVETEVDLENFRLKDIVLPNYSLMSYLAQTSLLSYIRTKIVI
ncbi:hypothetical protein [Desulfosporosinus fructosivorans]